MWAFPRCLDRLGFRIFQWAFCDRALPFDDKYSLSHRHDIFFAGTEQIFLGDGWDILCGWCDGCNCNGSIACILWPPSKMQVANNGTAGNNEKNNNIVRGGAFLTSSPLPPGEC